MQQSCGGGGGEESGEFNPLSTNSDKHLTSPYNITA